MGRSRSFILCCPFGRPSRTLNFHTIEDLLEIPEIRREVNADPPTTEELEKQELLKKEELPASQAHFEKLKEEFASAETWKQEDSIDMGNFSIERPSEKMFDFFGHRTTHTFFEIVQTTDTYNVINHEGKWRHLYSVWFDADGYKLEILLGYFGGALLDNVAKHEYL